VGLPPNDDRSPYPRSGGIHSQRHVEGRNEGKEGTEGNEGNEGDEVGEVGEVRDAEGGGATARVRALLWGQCARASGIIGLTVSHDEDQIRFTSRSHCGTSARDDREHADEATHVATAVTGREDTQ